MALAIATDDSSSQPAPEPKPLTHRTAHGFAWMLAQTIVAKVVSFLGQILVARFLTPRDFGIISLALAAAAFPSIIRDAGLQSILVQRQRHLKRWANPVFWMSFSLGVLTMLAMIALGPFAARYYGEAQLKPLLIIMGVGAMISSLGTVPQAMVMIQLRFRFQALLALATAVLTVILNVVLAWRGWGAYSFIVPLALVNSLRTFAYWIVVHHPFRWNLDLRRWRYLIGDSGMLLLMQFLYVAVANGDYLILGRRYKSTPDVVGQFYFAFNLSWQMLVLLQVNLANVLFPALSKLNADPARQTQAYLRSARVLALIGVPACILQAALARPGMTLVFLPKWNPSIPIMEVLSLAMAIRVVGLTYYNLAQAQGRFRLLFFTSLITAILFIIVVALTAIHGHGLAVAIAEAIFFTITDPFWMWIVIRKSAPNPAAEIAKIYRAPLLAGAVAFGIAMLAGYWFPNTRMGDVLKMFVIGVTGLSIYALLIRRAAPQPWSELMLLVRKLRP